MCDEDEIRRTGVELETAFDFEVALNVEVDLVEVGPDEVGGSPEKRV